MSEAADGGAKSYKLYASRITNAKFTGTIAKEDDISPSLSVAAAEPGASFVKAAKGTTNPSYLQTVTTGDDGEFTAVDIIPGDTYTVTPEGGGTETVTVENDGQDIGTITLVKGVNFKMRVQPRSQAYGEHLYINRDYDFTIEVENTGSENCTAASFWLGRTDNITVTNVRNLDGESANSDILQTIEPGMKKR